MTDVNFIGRWSLAIACLLCSLGCGSSSDSGANGGGSSMDQMAAQLDEQAAAREQEEARVAADKKAQEEAAAKAAAEAPPERKKAGRASVEPGGYANAIIGARRHALNEAESWAWKQAVNSFRAEHGRKPKDHDEFMNKIVKPLGIDLGFKEEDEEFLYDPNAESDGEFGVLYVVKKQSAQP
jgi:hypothetical protein